MPFPDHIFSIQISVRKKIRETVECKKKEKINENWSIWVNGKLNQNISTVDASGIK